MFPVVAEHHPQDDAHQNPQCCWLEHHSPRRAPLRRATRPLAFLAASCLPEFGRVRLGLAERHLDGIKLCSGPVRHAHGGGKFSLGVNELGLEVVEATLGYIRTCPLMRELIPKHCYSGLEGGNGSGRVHSTVRCRDRSCVLFGVGEFHRDKAAEGAAVVLLLSPSVTEGQLDRRGGRDAASLGEFSVGHPPAVNSLVNSCVHGWVRSWSAADGGGRDRVGTRAVTDTGQRRVRLVAEASQSRDGLLSLCTRVAHDFNALMGREP
jgi:hypothetical protein